MFLIMYYFCLGQVANLYHDVSIGNYINIVVTRLVLLTEDQVMYSYATHDYCDIIMYQRIFREAVSEHHVTRCSGGG